MHLYGGASNKPVNNYDVELVAARSESVDNYCKEHSMAPGDYTYTHVWQPTVELAQYQHATDLATSSSAVSGPIRHCCRDHVYESPTFDENGLDRCSPLVFPPYYYHAAAAARQSRPSEGCEARRTAIQLNDLTTDELRHQQQLQQPAAQQLSVGLSDERSGASAGAHEAASTTAVSAGEWYQPCRTTRYQQVVCRSSSSDPDVTLRPCTENHYT